jgi:hypothetical protein
LRLLRHESDNGVCDLAVIAARIVELCKKGNVEMIKEVWSRMEGKVADKLSIDRGDRLDSAVDSLPTILAALKVRANIGEPAATANGPKRVELDARWARPGEEA